MYKPFLKCLIFTIIVHHVRSYMIGHNPQHIRETLDHEGRYQLERLVNWEQKMITFHVTAQTTGYVEFGLSAKGQINGADIIIGGVNSDGKPFFADYHGVGDQIVRDSRQDWNFLAANENGSHTMISFSRALDTCDPQDYVITENRITLIWGLGTTNEIQNHLGRRGIYPVYLLHPDYSPQIITEPSTGIQRVLDDHGNVDTSMMTWTIHRELAVPPKETLYWCTMHKSPRISGSSKGHIAGFNVRYLNEEARIHVHHFLIRRCYAPRGDPSSARSLFDSFVDGDGIQCLMPQDSKPGEMPIELCTEFTYIWAVGGRSFFNPPHVGIPLESEGYYVFQIHLDNPNLLQDKRVHIAFDVFYTEKLRENEAGLISVRQQIPGLPPSFLIPPDTPNHQIRGMCGAQCTTNMLPPQGVSVYAGFLHTHTTGRKVRIRHFRSNRELPVILGDENYSSQFQQNRNLPQEIRILPGDQFMAECVYDSTQANGTVVGGLSTSQEMCATHMFHYQKLVEIEACDSQIVSAEARKHFLGIQNISWSDDAIDFVVDPPHPLAGMSIKNVSDNFVEWTSGRKEELDKLHHYHSQMNKCAPESWTLPPGVTQKMFPGYEISFPYYATPHQPEPSCTPRLLDEYFDN